MDKQELYEKIKKENTLDNISGEDIIKYMPENIRNRKEEWKDINGYEGFQVSDKGRVRYILDTPPAYKPYATKNAIMDLQNVGYGYFRVKGVRKYIHRLVALAFISNPNHYNQVNHKDEIKKHNWKENLEWCSPKHNVNWGTTPYRRNSAFREKLSTAETRRKISASRKGMKLSKETIRKMRIGLKGQKRSKEVIERMRKVHSKPIVQLTLDGKIIKKWKSQAELCETLKCGGGPARCCKGIKDSFRNCKWQYWRDYVKSHHEVL